MIPRECKRLAEVDFPIGEVSRYAASEKSARHGHPSTLHIWWARRPLSACRAVLLALLLPDPCDSACPEDFRAKARRALSRVRNASGTTNEELRKGLLKFIAEFSVWGHSAHPVLIEVARDLVTAAYPDQVPTVHDPFAGGGSIPMEALRVGCEAFASDLNPVACLVQRVMLEDIPRFGRELAQNLRNSGEHIGAALTKTLRDCYPVDIDGGVPVTYLWARTVRCERPNCGAEVPIYRSGWLTKKESKRARYFKESPEGNCVALLIESAPLGGPIRFRIARGFGSENEKPGYQLIAGTKVKGNNANVRCPCCGVVLQGSRDNPRVPQQLAEQQGGCDVRFDGVGRRVGGATLLAVVTSRHGQLKKRFRLPSDHDYVAVWRATQRVAENEVRMKLNGRPASPDESLPPPGTLGFRVQRYGMSKWKHLFTARQRLALQTLALEIQSISDPAVQRAAASVLSRCADYWSSGALWAQTGEFVAHTFGRQALPIVWDFAEAVPLVDSSGNFDGAVDWVARVIEAWPNGSPIGQVEQADARDLLLPESSVDVWFSDPPYYDAIPYSDLSDFFFVWLRRALPPQSLGGDPYDSSNDLTPKRREIVQDETKEVDGRPKDKRYFESSMCGAFVTGRRSLKDDGIGCVVFAHKTTEGWEALLSGLIGGGWVITASWPIATERPGRLRSQNSAALATSVHLVCRPRRNAEIGDWAQVFRELPGRVAETMSRLQSEGIRGADLVFACIGPALEIFSQHEKVVDAEDREIPLGGDPEAREPHRRGYLAYVWEVVGRLALEQVLGSSETKGGKSASGALEEDARLTALFLWTIQTSAAEAAGADEDEESEEIAAEDDEEEAAAVKPQGLVLIYDVARRFAQPLGIHMEVWEGRIVETRKGVVRLLPIRERSRILFGEAGSEIAADRIESTPAGSLQLGLFAGVESEAATPQTVRGQGRGRRGQPVPDESLETRQEATTLDRVHAAMLLQASGRSNALRALLAAEIGRSPDFLRLANALAVLYPKDSEEKRLVEAMLLAAPK